VNLSSASDAKHAEINLDLGIDFCITMTIECIRSRRSHEAATITKSERLPLNNNELNK
jgi:hypothetical protein